MAAYLELIIIVAAVVVDLVFKFAISKTLLEGESLRLIPKFLSFTYTKNYAAAFSSDFGLSKLLGDTGVRIFFIVLTFLALGLFFFMLISAKGGNKLYRVSLALIIGGAIGNLYDRIFYGFVRDFIDVEYFGHKLFGSYHFAIFNIADSALVVGVILLAVYFIFIYQDKKDKQETEKEGSSTEEQAEGEDSYTAEEKAEEQTSLAPTADEDAPIGEKN